MPPLEALPATVSLIEATIWSAKYVDSDSVES
jgi:hypothetical protein